MYLEGKNRLMWNKCSEALEEEEKLLLASHNTVHTITKPCLRGGHSPVEEESSQDTGSPETIVSMRGKGVSPPESTAWPAASHSSADGGHSLTWPRSIGTG